MTKTRILPLIAATALLAACGGSDEPEEVGGIPDPQAEELANAAPVDMSNVSVPLGGDTYRCGDGIYQIDFYQRGEEMTARVTPEGGSGVNLERSEESAPFTGEGFTLNGGPDADVSLNGADCIA